MTDPKQAFLRAIEQDFDNDVPRLVYADWLDENGEAERAEFIRLQCQVERVPAGPERAGMSPVEWERHWHAATTADRLLRAHRESWTVELPDWCRRGWPDFERGFPRIASFSGPRLLSDGATVRAVTPVGGSVLLWDVARVAAAVFGCEHLVHVTDLVLARNRLSNAALSALAASPTLSRLTALDLSGTGMGDNGLATLLRSPHLPNLQRLTLSDNPGITQAGCRMLLSDDRRWSQISLHRTNVSAELQGEMDARCEANR